MFNRLFKLKNVINLTSPINTFSNINKCNSINGNINSSSITMFNRLYGTNNKSHNNNNNNIQQNDRNTNDNGNGNVELCKVICTSRAYSKTIDNLPKGFSLQKIFDTSNTRWLIERDTGESVFVFPSFGCVVSWGGKEESLKSILEWVKSYEIRPYPTQQVDNFKFKISNSPSTSSFEINKRPTELLILSKPEKEQDIEKFSSSYAFAQSISLFPLEDKVQKLSEMVEDGNVTQLTKTEILRQLGEQLKIKSNLNLHSDINDTPEHFWENIEGEDIYNAVRRHCEINKRIRVMNEKLNLITDIYEVEIENKKHNHSIRLERIIIFLIAMEIFITLLRELRDYIQEKKSKH